ncbi:Coiled-coil and C2 domain-containing protein 2A [Chytridiales sp. JEL 0842]|nr:Coiled-coil and C2 domain-containing protein 2A [Chytridiales sp. JEL 0842]
MSALDRARQRVKERREKRDDPDPLGLTSKPPTAILRSSNTALHVSDDHRMNGPTDYEPKRKRISNSTSVKTSLDQASRKSELLDLIESQETVNTSSTSLVNVANNNSHRRSLVNSSISMSLGDLSSDNTGGGYRRRSLARGSAKDIESNLPQANKKNSGSLEDMDRSRGFGSDEERDTNRSAGKDSPSDSNDDDRGQNNGKRKKKGKMKKKKKEKDGSYDLLKDPDFDSTDQLDDQDFKRLAEKADQESIGMYVGLEKWEAFWKSLREAADNILFHPEKFALPTTGSFTALYESLRFPEEEGFYVGEPPKVPNSNLRKLERRLRMSEPNHGLSWFGPDQKLAVIPNPLRYRSQRPGAPPPLPVPNAASSFKDAFRSSLSLKPEEYVSDPYLNSSNESNDSMALVLKKALPSTPFRPITDNPDGTYLLVMTLGSLVIEEHPLLTDECKQMRQIENWISLLRARKKTDVVQYLTNKLESLKTAYSEFMSRSEYLLKSDVAAAAEVDEIYPAKPHSKSFYARHIAKREEAEREKVRQDHEDRRKEFLEDIRATRLLRDTEAQTNRLLEFKILQAWDNIKALRTEKGETSTSIKVLVRAKDPPISIAEEQRIFEQDLYEELNELEEMHRLEAERAKRRYRLAVREWKKRREQRMKDEEDQRDKEDIARRDADELAGKLIISREDQALLSDRPDTEDQLDDDTAGDQWLRDSVASLRKAEKKKKRQEEKQKAAEERRASENAPEERRQSLWDRFRAKSTSPTRKAKSATETQILGDVGGIRASMKRSKSESRASGIKGDLLAQSPGESKRQSSLKPTAIILSAPPPPRNKAGQTPEIRRDSGVVASPFDQPGNHEASKSPRLRTTPTQRKMSISKGDRIASIDEPSNVNELTQRPSIASRARSMSPARPQALRGTSKTRASLQSQDLMDRHGGRSTGTEIRRPKDIVKNDEILSKRERHIARESSESFGQTQKEEPDDAQVPPENRKMKSPKSQKSPTRKKKGLLRSEGPLYGSLDEIPTSPRIPAFNIEIAKQQIMQRLEASKKPPGAPILSISQVYTEPITEHLKCSREEQLRRHEVEETFVYIKIFYNDKEVTKTIPRPFDLERFTVPFRGLDANPIDNDQIVDIAESERKNREDWTSFGIKVREVPESIRVEVYETGIMGEQFIGEVFMAIPEPTETVRNRDREFVPLSFVGRPFNKRIESATSTQTAKWISGIIKINAAWGVNEEGRILGPQLKGSRSLIHGNSNLQYTDPLTTSGPSGLLNLRKLMEWINDLKIDPNDPRNAEILQLKKLVQMGYSDGLKFHEYWATRKFFRLHIPTKMQELTMGVGLDEPLNTRRLSLLHERHKGKVLVHGIVPIDDDDITEQLYEKVADPAEDESAAIALWSRQQSPAMSKKEDGHTNLETVGFLKKIRTHQLIQKARQSRPPRVEDFVREERLMEAQPQQNILLTLFQTRRPLKPVRTSHLSRATAQPENGCVIVVQVLRGFNIPVRRKDSKIEDFAQKNADERISVRTYVEITFQRRRCRTAVAEGPNPYWNETLTLDVKPPGNDFRPQSLLDSEVGMEMVYFNVFDEFLIDMIEDEREREVEIHQRKERNWIGSFAMPFTALYEQTRIEGAFQVEIPPVLLGYEKDPTAGPIDNSVLLGVGSTKETLINLFITLEPPLVQPSPLNLKFISDEEERLLRYSTQWVQSVTRFNTRPVLATTLDMTGQTTFICRFIRRQKPPPNLPTPRHLLRYVSTIPFLPDRTAFAADVSLWATSDQMLELGAGDSAEHAILLCNYLLEIGMEAHVVIGRGIPEGRTSYVLVKNKERNNDYLLMNAVTGQSYSANDPHLPLKIVGCVFNSDNIWANIQVQEDPSRINWNLNDIKMWRPFFCPAFPKIDYKSVQLETLSYTDVSNRYCKDLENLIEKTVVAKIEDWRGHRITRWNRLASKSFKPVVSRLEADHFSDPKDSQTNYNSYMNALAPLKNVYRINGFPLHCTYTDVNAIVELIHATDVHANFDPGAEFALAVWCGGYPGGQENL